MFRQITILSLFFLIFGFIVEVSAQQYEGCYENNDSYWSKFDFSFVPVGSSNGASAVLIAPDSTVTLEIEHVKDRGNVGGQRAAGHSYQENWRKRMLPSEFFSIIREVKSSDANPSGTYEKPIDQSSPPNGVVVRTLRRISDSQFSLDTSGLGFKSFWITLQGNVRFGENSCPKTSPPVLFRIEKVPTPTPTPTTNEKPTISLAVSGTGCTFRTIEATASDPDNFPTSRRLAMEWKITDSQNQELNFPTRSVGNPTDSNYKEVLDSARLGPGKYFISVTVSDGLATATATARIEIACVLAGAIYFQYDEPRPTRSNERDPEEWVNYFAVPGQCRAKKYPFTEFAEFYESLRQPIPTVSSNTAKLADVVERLRENPAYRVQLAGYADYRNNRTYNSDLVNRRLRVVEEYLRQQLPNLDIVSRSNFWDSTAQECNVNSCDDGRWHDRRVEIVYYIGDEPSLPTYQPSICPPNQE